ncbi:hypothetical protein HOL21_04440 [Candidatus Woesearchaeota archaeon]|jgi:hypothetical protein|nr:hypothetical protein [Candidatus Woesearchaeota archaeon]MBT5397436.1 hypothetical protein [Candidatus Woesearchaeota archaeon]MBT5924527.1 hypothetical protein [Candidatus Woesearchaeota archaeon]MBT6367070.1 hypothetical protein [Candidatus Woesearchaeota archaeon]MBT7762836.1 hypothetical protein [Candidatus Woesearchaeota archaeon]
MDITLLIIISVSVFLLILYYVSRKLKKDTVEDTEWQPFPERNKEVIEKPEEKMFDIPEQKKPSVFFIPILSPYLQRIKQKRKHKVHHQHQEDFFTEHGLAVPKPKNDVEKLQKVVHTHFNPKKQDTKDTFTKLRQHSRVSHRKKKQQESIHKDTFSELHKIVHKK